MLRDIPTDIYRITFIKLVKFNIEFLNKIFELPEFSIYSKFINLFFHVYIFRVKILIQFK